MNHLFPWEKISEALLSLSLRMTTLLYEQDTVGTGEPGSLLGEGSSLQLWAGGGREPLLSQQSLFRIWPF